MYKGFWYCYEDVPAGGDSAVELKTSALEKAAMKGRVNSRYEYSFVGMGYYLSPFDVRASFDLGKNYGLRFACKGNGNSFRVKIVSTHPSFINKDSDNQFGFDFIANTAPRNFEIPFASMSQQPGWGSVVGIKEALTLIKEIQFMTTTRPIERVELEIEGLEII
jgi:hypothetical protein